MKIIEHKEPKLDKRILMIGKRHSCKQCLSVVEFETKTDLGEGANESLYFFCPACNTITTIHANEIKP